MVYRRGMTLEEDVAVLMAEQARRRVQIVLLEVDCADTGTADGQGQPPHLEASFWRWVGAPHH